MIVNTVILPVLLHMFTAVLLLFLWRKPGLQKALSVVANVVVLFASVLLFAETWQYGYITLQAGKWPAPFGITFVADVFSSLLVLLSAIVGLAVSIYSASGISTNRVKYGYYPILHFLLMGLAGAFLTGDIFNLYVWFEIIIISSFVLMTLGGRKPQIGGGIKYVAMNLLASVIFLTAIAILYGLTGSLNMADLAGRIKNVESRGLVDVTASLFLIAFGIKSAVFPLYFWLPSSYHTPPSAIAAIFAGLLTKVGVYALIRIFTLIFIPDAFTRNLILMIAVATLVTGALGALVKPDLRQIFSYLIVCHIGYMIVGVAFANENGITGAVYYLTHDIIVKTNLFLITGYIFKMKGTVKLSELGGLYADAPKLSLLFALVFFSLVGVPPLSGFWPKIWLTAAAFNGGSIATVLAIVFASVITLVVIAKVWSQAFWKPQSVAPIENPFRSKDIPTVQRVYLLLPIGILAFVTLYIGLAAENIYKVSSTIATQLLQPQLYVDAVMGR